MPAPAPSVQISTKPKNARSKRALKAREPKLKESAKNAIFVKGQSTSEAVKVALKELMQLKKPDALSFSKSNSIHPFENSDSLAFWSKKNDASLFLVGLHSKKRPNNLVFARTFDSEVLDMMELGIESFKSMNDYTTTKPGVGQRPLFHFSGELFSNHPLYQQFKSMILDFFHGEDVDRINLAGLEHVISCTVGAQDELVDGKVRMSSSKGNGEKVLDAVKDLTGDAAPGASSSAASIVNGMPSTSTSTTTTSASELLPLIHFRTFTTSLLSSGTRVPKLGLSACGPDFDFRIRRSNPATADAWKLATKKPKKASLPGQIAGQKRKDRNVDIDIMGDKVGKLHLEKQDLSKLQSRKMKGLKKANDALGAEEKLVNVPLAREEGVQLDDGENGRKRARV